MTVNRPIQVHRHSGYQLIQQPEWNPEPLCCVAHGHKNRVDGDDFRIGARANLAPCAQPSVQADAALFNGDAFVVGQIVGLAHEGVDGADGISSWFWKSDKGVIKILRLASGDRPARRVGRLQSHWKFLAQAVFSVRRALWPRRKKGSNLAVTALSNSAALVLFEIAGLALRTS